MSLVGLVPSIDADLKKVPSLVAMRLYEARRCDSAHGTLSSSWRIMRFFAVHAGTWHVHVPRKSDVQHLAKDFAPVVNNDDGILET